MKQTATEAERAAEHFAELGELIRTGEARRIRVQSGLSLDIVGRSLEVDGSSIFRWESGERRPRPHRAAAYLRLLRKLDSVSRMRSAGVTT